MKKKNNQNLSRAHALRPLVGLSQSVSVFKSGGQGWTSVSVVIVKVPDLLQKHRAVLNLTHMLQLVRKCYPAVNVTE